MGRKCCSNTTTVKPFGATNLVGTISAAPDGETVNVAKTRVNTDVPRHHCSPRRRIGRTPMLITAFPAGLRQSAARPVLVGLESSCQPSGSPRADTVRRHAAHPWL